MRPMVLRKKDGGCCEKVRPYEEGIATYQKSLVVAHPEHSR
jgi:hypothetical protein